MSRNDGVQGLFLSGDGWKVPLREAMYGRGSGGGGFLQQAEAERLVVLNGVNAGGTPECVEVRVSEEGQPGESGQSRVLFVEDATGAAHAPKRWVLKIAKPGFEGHLKREHALGIWQGLPVPTSRLWVEQLWVPAGAGLGDAGVRAALLKQWVAGENLLEALLGRPGWFGTWGSAPTLARTLGGLLAVCEAVATLHARGVTHRDLKPQNVLLRHFTGGGTEVVLIDLGLAKWAGSGGVTQDDADEPPKPGGPGTLTATGQGPVGTRCYHPTNAKPGAYKAAEATWDVYALAAMALECLMWVYTDVGLATGFVETPVGRELAAGALQRETLDRVFEGTPAAKKELLDLLFAQVDPLQWKGRPFAAGMSEDAGAFGAALAAAIK